jgi:hypothetical protein
MRIDWSITASSLPKPAARETADHPGTGLVEVDGISLGQQIPRPLGEGAGGTGCLGNHLGQGPDRDLLAEHVGEQLGHAVEGQVLVDSQVGGQGTHPGAIDGRGRRCPREGRLGRAPTSTTAALGRMFGDSQADLGEIEDLAVFGVDHLGTGKITTTATTRVRCMDDHCVWIGHLGQVLAGGSGLLPLLALGSPTFGPGRRRRLGEPFGRRWHRRVAGVATDALFEVSQFRLERHHLCTKLGVLND